jgi:hypothetical protein
VAADLKLAKRLMVVMDRERDISDNPLLPELADIMPAEEEGQGENTICQEEWPGRMGSIRKLRHICFGEVFVCT